MKAILCLGLDNGLGKGSELVYRIPQDLKRFKEITSGGAIIMGRKTYESLPGPLPNRLNIVISRNENYAPHPDVQVCNTKEQTIRKVKDVANVYVIGGGEIYRLFEDQTDHIYLTRIISKPKSCDVFYNIPLERFDLVSLCTDRKYKDIIYNYEEWVLKGK